MPFNSVSGGNALCQIKRASEQSEGHKSNTFTRTLGERRHTFKDGWGGRGWATVATNTLPPALILIGF